MAKPTAEERFWSHVDRRGPDDCWLWTGRLDRDGYGVFKVERAPKRVHRFAYELLVGPILGETLDHNCHTHDPSCQGGPTCIHRRCVNPAHLISMSVLEGTN